MAHQFKFVERDNDVESAGALLVMAPDTEKFFKAETGIQDTEELRKHIIQTQQEAYKIYPYPCIRGFIFTELNIAGTPAYPRALQLLKNRPDAIFLDIGCCVGTDLRKAVYDGWPISQTLATDLEAGYWDVGHKLFRTTPETYPVKFMAGDAFDDAYLCPTAPIPPGPPPPVASVNTLTELLGHVSVIYSSSVFHLFNEEKQLEFAKRFAALLDRRPGSIIFGSHMGMPVKGQPSSIHPGMFCHSAESWTKMWEEEVFEGGQVKATAILVDAHEVAVRLGMAGGPPGSEGAKLYGLAWSVERL